jgi:pentatricopeptide repeat-containing protein PET309
MASKLITLQTQAHYSIFLLERLCGDHDIELWQDSSQGCLGMLERTGGCLETGSLRRLLPGSRTPSQSRRLLHSSFWSHSGAALEISPFWQALIHGPEGDVESGEAQQNTTTAKPSGIYLDFLYPSGAVKLLKQYYTWGDRSDGRHSRAGLLRGGQRLYSSTAKDTNDAAAVEPDIPHHELSDIDGLALDAPLEPLITPWLLVPPPVILGEFSDDHASAWQHFEKQNIEDQRRLAPEILQLLSKSKRTIDAERATQAFYTILRTASPKDFEAVSRAYLLLGNISEAKKLIVQCLKRSHVLVNTGRFIASCIEQGNGSDACFMWQKFRRFQQKHREFQLDIWAESISLKDLPEKILGLAQEHERSHTQISSRERRAPNQYRSFLCALIEEALFPRESAAKFNSHTFGKLFTILQKWNHVDANLYQKTMERLLEMGQKKTAAWTFKLMSEDAFKELTPSILEELMKIFSQDHDIMGVQKVLDQYRIHQRRPRPNVLRLAMSEHAARGDVDTVEQLFGQYLDWVPKINNADDVAPLLHVHVVRGELSKVIEIFDKMKHLYGVSPNVKCWNILINAYGKANQVDEAFEVYENLLETDLKPTDYTFGTVMGIATTRGDPEKTREIYENAKSYRIKPTAAMVDCIVLGYIKEDQLKKAERTCENALKVKVSGPLTRMWNQLLGTYAMRRDIESVNRLLNKMRNLDIRFDTFTYVTLLEALTMAKQADHAFRVLKEVMFNSGIKVNAYHYAIVMGGFIANNQIDRVFDVHLDMLKRKITASSDTNINLLKGVAIKDQRLLEFGSEESKLERAEELFLGYYLGNKSDSSESGPRTIRQNFADSSTYFEYLIFVYGQIKAASRAEELYQTYLSSLPENQRSEPPLGILSAIMVAYLKQKKYEGVQEGWRRSFEQAKKFSMPVKATNEDRALYSRRLMLSRPLMWQMESLAEQRKFAELRQTIHEFQSAGFELDRKNWNLYVQLLTNSPYYLEAFELCEAKLMPGWFGWARLRWHAPVRNRLSIEQRALKEWKPYLFPNYHTLLFLAKVYLELSAAKDSDKLAHDMFKLIKNNCGKTTRAIASMPRTQSELERQVLGVDEWTVPV